MRLEGIDTMLKLASKSFLLPSVQYAMLCGWQRVIPEGTNIGYVNHFWSFGKKDLRDFSESCRINLYHHYSCDLVCLGKAKNPIIIIIMLILIV